MLILIPLAFVALGVLLIVAGVRTRRSDTGFAAGARRATGTVTELKWKGSGGSRGPDAYPVVRFELPEGRTVEAQSRYGGRPAPAREGDAVTVLYDPADPSRMELEGSAAAGGFLTAVLVFIGVGFALLGGFLALVFYLLRDAF